MRAEAADREEADKPGWAKRAADDAELIFWREEANDAIFWIEAVSDADFGRKVVDDADWVVKDLDSWRVAADKVDLRSEATEDPGWSET